MDNCKFDSTQVNTSCEEIFRVNFNDLGSYERSLLIDEYHRLGELPSLGLISEGRSWDEFQCNESSGRWYLVEHRA